jgi:hypothetical protein
MEIDFLYNWKSIGLITLNRSGYHLKLMGFSPENGPVRSPGKILVWPLGYGLFWSPRNNWSGNKFLGT